MIQVAQWMNEAVNRLWAEFGNRLLFVGLQGSYGRGEAGGDSDIDIQVVLDTLSVGDLARYRAVLRGLPEGEKACGFISGRAELARWPAHEIFAFVVDTTAFYGDIRYFVPPFTDADIWQGIRVRAAGLYHETAHLYVSGDAAGYRNGLKNLLKPVFFILRDRHFLATREQLNAKEALLSRLGGQEHYLLWLSMHPEEMSREGFDPGPVFQMLLHLSGGILRQG